jgi:hypothetical protein
MINAMQYLWSMCLLVNATCRCLSADQSYRRSDKLGSGETVLLLLYSHGYLSNEYRPITRPMELIIRSVPHQSGSNPNSNGCCSPPSTWAT